MINKNTTLFLYLLFAIYVNDTNNELLEEIIPEHFDDMITWSSAQIIISK